jgi:hypothetical protein
MGSDLLVHAVPRVLKEALVAWDHGTKTPLPVRPKAQSAAFTKTFNLAEKDAFLQGHVVDNRIVIPVCFTYVHSSEPHRGGSYVQSTFLQKLAPKLDMDGSLHMSSIA